MSFHRTWRGVLLATAVFVVLLVGTRAPSLLGSLRPAALPDYSAENIRIFPPTPVAGEPYAIAAFIHNFGPGSAERRSAAQASIDENQEGSWGIVSKVIAVPSIAAGRTAAVRWESTGTSATLDQPLVAGPHRVRVCAAIPTPDPDLRLLDANRDNNCTEKIFMVAPPPSVKTGAAPSVR